MFQPIWAFQVAKGPTSGLVKAGSSVVDMQAEPQPEHEPPHPVRTSAARIHRLINVFETPAQFSALRMFRVRASPRVTILQVGSCDQQSSIGLISSSLARMIG